MLIKTTVKKASGKFKKYNLWWPASKDPIALELDMITHGGQWTKGDGEKAGEGLAFHYRKFQELIWVDRIWQSGPFVNFWAEKCLETYLNHTYIGVMGCAASGKSDSFGCNLLTDWYAHCSCTTGIVTSTDLKSLELRIWGMIKKYHRSARYKRSWIPGHLIEGKQMLILDEKSEFTEGRDFKNGIVAVACKRGSQYVGLGPMIGIHNKRVRLVADEANLMPRAFLDSTSNLSKCEDFKLVALGNPNETTNAHGVVCEPEPALGGWEGGIDQSPGTKTWKTRFPNGICLQLPGSDSPNMHATEEQSVPFPFLITRKQMQDDAAIWGVDDWHYTMMNEARMPRGQGSRRVLTRQACVKFGAFGDVLWRDTRITKIGFLDAAYRGVGGDRCVFGELQVGYETEKDDGATHVGVMLNALADQTAHTMGGKQVVKLIDTVIVPVVATKDSDQPEDQIVAFVKNALDSRGIDYSNFFYDSGMRTTLVTAFARSGMEFSNAIDCGGKASEEQVSAEIKKVGHEYYSKKITEFWFSVRLAVESGQFRGMTEEVCTEFGQREWKLVSGNRIEVESKEDMKLKTGRSPDLADGVAVGLHGARLRGFRIQKLASPDRTVKREEGWRDELREKARRLRKAGALQHSA